MSVPIALSRIMFMYVINHYQFIIKVPRGSLSQMASRWQVHRKLWTLHTCHDKGSAISTTLVFWSDSSKLSPSTLDAVQAIMSQLPSFLADQPVWHSSFPTTIRFNCRMESSRSLSVLWKSCHQSSGCIANCRVFFFCGHWNWPHWYLFQPILQINHSSHTTITSARWWWYWLYRLSIKQSQTSAHQHLHSAQPSLSSSIYSL